ncbi:MAG: hypothetical protein VZR64_00425 [Eubacterium sp.]|nr:hypothetical protein [Eubacterium sp.]
MEAYFTQLNPTTLIVSGLILILLLVFNSKLFKFLNNWLEYKITELQLKKYDIDIHLDVTEDIEKRLDYIIGMCFQEYDIMNLSNKGDWYITEKDEIQISKDVCALVSERLSPIMMQQLAVYFNEEAIMSIIAKRVSFKITTYVIDHNKGTSI